MCKCDNPYIPYPAEIIDIVKHTPIEWTFRVKADTSETKPGQFYEISLAKFGESPISVSGVGPDFIDFTIRAVGRVTNEIFENYGIGDNLFIRGPYGNGFDLNEYKGKDLVIVVGGSALAPVRGIIQFVYNNPSEVKSFKLIAGFKSPKDVLFAKDLEEWSKKLDVLLTVDGAEEGYTGNIGLVTKYIPEIKFDDLSNASAVVVGPPMMMKFSVAEFLKLNVPEKWIQHIFA